MEFLRIPEKNKKTTSSAAPGSASLIPAFRFGRFAERGKAAKRRNLLPDSLLVAVIAQALLLITSAQAQTLEAGGSLPLSTIMRADGSVDLTKGISGSFNVEGWRMTTDANGEPRFVSTVDPAASSVGPEADSSDSFWDDQFVGIAGVSSQVDAALITPTGKLIVGGTIGYAGGVLARNIAQWDGVRWSAFGSGVDFKVMALAVNGNEIYAGGYFNSAPASGHVIARWDGSAWHNLGTGMPYDPAVAGPAVSAIVVIGSDVYVGGGFNGAGETSAANIARWDGTTWHTVGGSVNDGVCSLAVSGTDLYVGGAFTSAGGVPANRIAKWNGTNWSALGTGMNDVVWSLAVIGTNVYAGGSFMSAGGVSASRVAYWNGTTWSAMGSGLFARVTDLVVFDGSVCALMDGSASVRRWTGSAWSSISGSFVGSTFALAAEGTSLYVGGLFSSAGGTVADSIVRYSSGTWSRLGTAMGMDAGVYALAVRGNDLYVGGNFKRAGTVPANYIARWDGRDWHPLGSGTDQPVRAITFLNGELYAGGWFTQAGGLSANRVARWDGSAWHPLGSGISATVGWPYATVRCLGVKGNDLFVGGNFTHAGGSLSYCIARWDGSTWSAIGAGIAPNSSSIVKAIVPMEDDIIAAGYSVTTIGSPNQAEVIKWDGAAWSSIAAVPGVPMMMEGIPEPVIIEGFAQALSTMGGDLYAGGRFNTIGETSATNIARWDGTNWHPLGQGTDEPVTALATIGNSVYVSGQFSHAGAISANCVARWKNSVWSVLGSGLDNSGAEALALHGNSLIVGGEFHRAGDKTSYHIAVWQPRVNTSLHTMTDAPGALVIGDDPYGLQRPALVTFPGTTVTYAQGLPTTSTIDRAPEIHVAGRRVNGAFTAGPEGMQFDGAGASIRVEFSEDDVATYPGKSYTDFRAVRLTYPPDYPTNKEAAGIEAIPGQNAPLPIRIDNEKQIYAITVPMTQITSTYGAVPVSLAQIADWHDY